MRQSKNITLLFVLIVGLGTNVIAQQKQHAPGFRSIQHISLINGKGAVSAGLQSVNGIRLGNWFAGAGAGLDFYRYRSVPLFLDIRREFGLNKGKLFVYADGGYNLPWVTDGEDVYNAWPGSFYKVDNKYDGGIYTDAGIGYVIYHGSRSALVLSVGYSIKKFKKQVITTSSYTPPQQEPVVNEDVKKFNYNFNRLMIKIGWQF